MGATKTDHFTDKQNEIATLAKALGHPARIAIMEYLLKVDTCICGDIVNELPLAQPTVSQHLKELKNAGLIKGDIEGNKICYCIDEKVLNKLQAYFGNIATKLEKRKLIAVKHLIYVHMKIALFSDIHANLPALQAFFKDVDSRNPDAIYCLGDLVGYNIWANEVVNEIKNRKIPTIAGNYDFGIGRMSNDCGCAYKTDQEKDNGKISIAFTNAIMKDEEREYLRTLPAHIKVEFQLNEDKLNLLLVHGSPRKINEYLFEDREEKSLLRIMEQADADIMCFGHTHKPYHRILNSGVDGQNHFRHAINIGSVGKPKDRNPLGGYVMLTINENSSILDKDSIKVAFIRFDYDFEAAAKAVEESPLPNEFADMLRNGV